MALYCGLLCVRLLGGVVWLGAGLTIAGGRYGILLLLWIAPDAFGQMCESVTNVCHPSNTSTRIKITRKKKLNPFRLANYLHFRVHVPRISLLFFFLLLIWTRWHFFLVKTYTQMDGFECWLFGWLIDWLVGWCFIVFLINCCCLCSIHRPNGQSRESFKKQ